MNAGVVPELVIIYVVYKLSVRFDKARFPILHWMAREISFNQFSTTSCKLTNAQ